MLNIIWSRVQFLTDWCLYKKQSFGRCH